MRLKGNLVPSPNSTVPPPARPSYQPLLNMTCTNVPAAARGCSDRSTQRALLCTSIPAVATAQSPTKPPFWKSLLALVSGSMLNQDTLLLHQEDLLLVHQEDQVATGA